MALNHITGTQTLDRLLGFALWCIPRGNLGTLFKQNSCMLANATALLSNVGSFLQVTPVIGRVPSQMLLKPNPSEVNAVFDMPLAAFLEDVPSHTFKDTEWAGLSFRIHYFEYNHFLVWGLTAAILIDIAQKAFARPPGFLELSPGSRPYHQLLFNGERLLWRDDQT